MFGEKDVFLAIFNPLYFAEGLGESGRNLLERYLPSVPHESIMGKLCEGDRALLENERMPSPEGFLRSLREEIKTIENDIIYTEGQRDLLGTQGCEVKTDLKRLRAELAETRERAAGLENKNTEGIDIPGMKEALADMYARYDGMLKELPAPADTVKIDERLTELSGRLARRRAESYISKYTGAIAEASAGFETAKKRYGSEKSVYAKLAPGVRCPVCRRSVTKDNIGEIKKAFKESMDALAAEGGSYKEQLAELKALDLKASSVFDKFKADDIAKIETETRVLCEERAVILADAEREARTRLTESDALKAEITSLESDIASGGLSEDELSELSLLREAENRLSAEADAAEDREKALSLDRDKKNVEKLRTSVKEKRRLEAAVKCYIAERVNLRFRDFNMLNRVSVMLCELTKSTGEIKDVFRLSYEGRPYTCLSLSERIKTGLEISALMQRLTGVTYPVFIDNGESVPVIDNVKPAGQVFIALVAKGAPLAVKIAGRAPSAREAA
jgi:hypothetical protein